MTFNKRQLQLLNTQFDDITLQEALKIVSQTFSGKIAFSSSLGLEDQVLTDAIFTQDLPIEVFTLDTGRLYPETYQLLDDTYRRYRKSIKVYYPNQLALEDFVSRKGINGIYDSIEDRKTCCHLRKIEPLNRALQGVSLWITGIRKAQSQYRSEMALFEWDESRELVKFNPLAIWSTDDLWSYIHENNVPYNPLHEKGFPSIGCAPCTRAVTAGEDERAGRWWWENEDRKECGLHTRVDLPSIKVA